MSFMRMRTDAFVGNSIGKARTRPVEGMKRNTERGIKVTHRPAASSRSRRLMESVRRRAVGMASPTVWKCSTRCRELPGCKWTTFQECWAGPVTAYAKWCSNRKLRAVRALRSFERLPWL